MIVKCTLFTNVFLTSENFFTSPLQSSLLGKVVVCGLHDVLISVKLSAIEAKRDLLRFRKRNMLQYHLLILYGKRKVVFVFKSYSLAHTYVAMFSVVIVCFRYV